MPVNPKLLSAKLDVRNAQTELGAARAAATDVIAELKSKLAAAEERIAELEAALASEPVPALAGR
jgi:BMFP domain-containing protein YqiC